MCPQGCLGTVRTEAKSRLSFCKNYNPRPLLGNWPLAPAFAFNTVQDKYCPKEYGTRVGKQEVQAAEVAGQRRAGEAYLDAWYKRKGI